MERGDIVYLKSGSPSMTVVDITIDVVVCCWFVGTDYHEAKFPITSLTPASTKQKKPKPKNIQNSNSGGNNNRKMF